MVPCLPESFCVAYRCYFFTLLGVLLIVLQPFDFFFFQSRKQQQEQGHMGEKHAIYSGAATGIGPRVPDAQREVCRPGDDEARHPHRAHKTVSIRPYRAFSYCLAFPAYSYPFNSDKLVRRHSVGLLFVHSAMIEL